MFSVLALATSLAIATAAPLAAYDLRTEYVRDPIVIDVADPRFYWRLATTAGDRAVYQSAYRVIVNRSLDSTTVWDSGVISSQSSSHVVYSGAPLASDTQYQWAVTYWDNNNNQSPWSQTAYFATGLLTQAEWTVSDWIGCPQTLNYNQIRSEFTLPAGVTVKQARVYITGLGYYKLRVNGQPAFSWNGDSVLDPAWSNYPLRVFYNAYDITNQLVPGQSNAFAIWMGNGWPNTDPIGYNGTTKVSAYATPEGRIAAMERNKNIHMDFNTPELQWSRTNAVRKIRAQIFVHLSDGENLVWTSNAASFEGGEGYGEEATTWMCGTGSLLDDSVYDGCVWDQGKYTTGWDMPNYNAANWVQAVLASDPGGQYGVPTTLTAQAYQSVQVIKELKPRSVTQPRPGMFVFDTEQNLSGFIRLTLPAPVPAGLNITIKHGEVLNHPPYAPVDGTVYYDNLRTAKQTDIYITAGSVDQDEVFEPVFTYHGFRFVEITGLYFTPTIDSISVLHVRSAVDFAGSVSFAASANVMNQLQRALSWGQASQLMSVPSDCPQRDERKGWMGDSGLTLDEATYNFDMAAFYTFWATSIRDSQLNTIDTHPAGSVADTNPRTFGNYPSDPSWGTVFPGVIYTMWKVYGDVRLATNFYPALVSYLDFMATAANSSTIGSLYEYYGDWCPPPAVQGGGQGPKPPKSFAAAHSYIVDVGRAVEIATALGNSVDAAKYAALQTALLAGFNAAFFNPTTNVYGNANGDGRQTAHSIGVYIGAARAANAEAAVVQNLVDDIVNTHNNHWSVGIIGMKYMHKVLTAFGFGNTAIDTVIVRNYPGFSYWFNEGPEQMTTLSELPDGDSEGPSMNSRNHIMFGGIGAWLYSDVIGITQEPTSTNYDHVRIHPRISGHPELPYASGTHATYHGTVEVSWQNQTGSAVCAADVGENQDAVLTCPGGSVVSAITFASFGTPTGTCGNFSLSTCNAANTTSIVSSLCLGKNTCTISGGDNLFGDPCYDTVKHLDIQVSCSIKAVFTLATTIPPNSVATILVPYTVGLGTSTIGLFDSVTGTSQPIYNNGVYVPGVNGITSAALNVNLNAVEVHAGSGSYLFTLTQ
jgi:alpha-L-rhamnosidase